MNYIRIENNSGMGWDTKITDELSGKEIPHLHSVVLRIDCDRVIEAEQSFLQEPHKGDCTNESCLCNRCYVERFWDAAREISWQVLGVLDGNKTKA